MKENLVRLSYESTHLLGFTIIPSRPSHALP
jgi:hypothetical protein